MIKAKGDIYLPASKSLSNRVLIIKSLCDQSFPIQNLSKADDTVNLDQHLAGDLQMIHVGPAGTNMRFLVSLLAIKPGLHTLTGSERLNERPIQPLVDALRSIGAQIEYISKDGFPPLKITGRELEGGHINIQSDASSQFISSLLMIAPVLKKGLHIHLEGKKVSWPYVEMTLQLMSEFGIEYELNDSIRIGHQAYLPHPYTVEADWSAAAFWFGIVACSPHGTSITLKNISRNSLQGDRMIIEFAEKLGVITAEKGNDLTLTKQSKAVDHFTAHLNHYPNLFPVLAFTCAALRINCHFTGLHTLNLKESKRIEAVQTELKKCGALCHSSESEFNITAYKSIPGDLEFQTYNDHRMAMSASVFINSHDVTIHDPEVVSKSYPGFWEDLKTLGLMK